VEHHNDSRFERGLAKLAEVDGTAGEEVVAPLGDLGRYVVEFAYGDIYSRADLSLRERAIATVALLTALGGREPQLRFHLDAGLKAGLTAEELEEVVIQTVPYAGFPTAINALNLLREVVRAAGPAARQAGPATGR
jgi:4-carboxymuconolactone decarboxylase